MRGLVVWIAFQDAQVVAGSLPPVARVGEGAGDVGVGTPGFVSEWRSPRLVPVLREEVAAVRLLGLCEQQARLVRLPIVPKAESGVSLDQEGLDVHRNMVDAEANRPLLSGNEMRLIESTLRIEDRASRAQRY